MTKRQIQSDKIRQPSGHFSQAIAIEANGKLVFISGMTSRRPDGTIAGIGDVSEQTRQVCENIKAAVEAAGGTMADICRVDAYVRNMEHLDAITHLLKSDEVLSHLDLQARRAYDERLARGARPGPVAVEPQPQTEPEATAEPPAASAAQGG